MRSQSLPIRITSIVIVLTGVGLLALNIYMGDVVNLNLPLVFLMVGGGFLVVLFRLRQKWAWASLLYIPAALFIGFGIIFLLNILTGDWRSWAYAWLFVLAALGIGILLANREQSWHRLMYPAGWGLTLGGLSLFAIFGVITGGVFIRVMAPILLVAAGLSLRWLRLETILPTAFSQKLHPALNGENQDPAGAAAADPLVEALSVREVEVLRLIDAGLSNQQIAGKLSVAPSTVKTHINNIYGKLGVQTRVQALNRARGLNLLDS